MNLNTSLPHVCLLLVSFLVVRRVDAGKLKTSGEVLRERITYEDFTQLFSKQYDNQEEYQRRKAIFESRLDQILAHNAEYAAGKRTWHMGINKYSDWTAAEIKERRKGYIRRRPEAPGRHQAVRRKTGPLEGTNFVLAKSSKHRSCFDWRKKGVVTEVKEQTSECGACWAFATTGMLESYFAIQNIRAGNPPDLVSLSEQQPIDCTFDGKKSVNGDPSTYGSHGCNGGHVAYAFDYIKSQRGLNTEKCYPYEAMDGKPCRTRKSCTHDRTIPVGDLYGLNELDDDFLESAGRDAGIIKLIHELGPLYISLETTDNFDHYSGGILDDPLCKVNSTDYDHSVLLVGYCSEGEIDYWIIKNSWGVSHGEDGYYRIKRGQCAIGVDVEGIAAP